jgi:fucose 4-O-acetylase-like acetyltransferase
MSTVRKSASRVEWLDAARGGGIFLVVLGHVAIGLLKAGIDSSAWYSGLIYALYVFHMPLFFVLSGINAPAGLARGRGAFVLAKLWTIAYPYILWSLLQGVVLITFSAYANAKYEVSSLYSILWAPMSQFWFLYVLMLLQLLVAVIGVRPYVLATLAILAVMIRPFLELNTVPEQIAHSLPFFVAGILLADQAMSLGQARLNPWPAALWILFAAVAWLLYRYSGEVVPADAFTLINAHHIAYLPLAIVGIAAFIGSIRLLDGRSLSGLAYIGRATMTIYVMHVVLISAARLLLTKLHVPPVAMIYLPVCTLIGVAVPVCLHSLLARFHLLHLAGLAPLPRRQPA